MAIRRPSTSYTATTANVLFATAFSTAVTAAGMVGVALAKHKPSIQSLIASDAETLERK
jgi:hypothetical protein